jgi:hypothetical protein
VGKVRCFGRIAEEWGDGGDEEEEEGKVKMRIGDVVLLQSEFFFKGFSLDVRNRHPNSFPPAVARTGSVR